MFGPIINMLFGVIALTCATAAYGQSDQDNVRLELKSRPGNALPDTLPVYVEIATFQPNVEQGIVFTLNIENNSTETVRILDPIDTMGIILNGLTRPRSQSLQSRRPDCMTCFIRSISVEEYRALQIRKNAERPFQAFDVDEAQRDRHLKTVSDIEPWTPPQNHPVRVLHSEIPSSEADRLDGTLDRKLSRQPWQRFLVVPKEVPMTISDRFENMPGGKLTLEPGQRFEAIVQITKVIADRDALRNAREKWQRENIAEDGTKVPGAAPWPRPDIIPIPSGKYSLYVGVVLYTNDTDSYYTASAKDITIQLGELDSAGKNDTIIP